MIPLVVMVCVHTSSTCMAVLAIFLCLVVQSHGACDPRTYHILQHFAPDVPADDITVSDLSACARQCRGIGSNAMFMYDSDSMTCQCYGMPLAVTNVDPGVSLYVAGK